MMHVEGNLASLETIVVCGLDALGNLCSVDLRIYCGLKAVNDNTCNLVV